MLLILPPNGQGPLPPVTAVPSCGLGVVSMPVIGLAQVWAAYDIHALLRSALALLRRICVLRHTTDQNDFPGVLIRAGIVVAVIVV